MYTRYLKKYKRYDFTIEVISLLDYGEKNCSSVHKHNYTYLYVKFFEKSRNKSYILINKLIQVMFEIEQCLLVKVV